MTETLFFLLEVLGILLLAGACVVAGFCIAAFIAGVVKLIKEGRK